MKKSLLGILAGAALSISLAACGEKLLSPEQVQAEIDKGYEAGRAAVESEMNSKCDAEFDARVTMAVDSMMVADSLANMPMGR